MFGAFFSIIHFYLLTSILFFYQLLIPNSTSRCGGWPKQPVDSANRDAATIFLVMSNMIIDKCHPSTTVRRSMTDQAPARRRTIDSSGPLLSHRQRRVPSAGRYVQMMVTLILLALVGVQSDLLPNALPPPRTSIDAYSPLRKQESESFPSFNRRNWLVSYMCAARRSWKHGLQRLVGSVAQQVASHPH